MRDYNTMRYHITKNYRTEYNYIVSPPKSPCYLCGNMYQGNNKVCNKRPENCGSFIVDPISAIDTTRILPGYHGKTKRIKVEAR